MLKNPEFMMTFAELGNNWEINEISLLSKIEVFVCAMDAPHAMVLTS